LVLTVPDALNPRSDIFKDNPHITGAEAQERVIEVVDFAELLRSDKQRYADIGLSEWASVLPDTLSFSQEQLDRFKELIKDGNIPSFLPDKQTQLDTIEKAIEVFKPIWIKGGVKQKVEQTAHNWDHFKELTANKAPELVIGVPDRPYISFTKPTQSPPEETKNKNLEDQKKLFAHMQRNNPRLFVMNPTAYLALQDIWTRRAQEYATSKNLTLTTLTPHDSGDLFTRFINLPKSASGAIPSGNFWPGNARLKLGGSDAGSARPNGGFRREMREEI
jgi:hypothetical protein